MDEAALREKLPLRKSDWHKEYLDWAIPAFRLVHAKVKPETQVGPGVYDIHSPRVPSEQEIVDALHKIIAKVPQQNVWVNPDCGLKTRGEIETTASLKNLVAAAKKLRNEK